MVDKDTSKIKETEEVCIYFHLVIYILHQSVCPSILHLLCLECQAEQCCSSQLLQQYLIHHVVLEQPSSACDIWLRLVLCVFPLLLRLSQLRYRKQLQRSGCYAVDFCWFCSPSPPYWPPQLYLGRERKAKNKIKRVRQEFPAFRWAVGKYSYRYTLVVGQVFTVTYDYYDIFRHWAPSSWIIYMPPLRGLSGNHRYMWAYSIPSVSTSNLAPVITFYPSGYTLQQ